MCGYMAPGQIAGDVRFASMVSVIALIVTRSRVGLQYAAWWDSQTRQQSFRYRPILKSRPAANGDMLISFSMVTTALASVKSVLQPRFLLQRFHLLINLSVLSVGTNDDLLCSLLYGTPLEWGSKLWLVHASVLLLQ